MIVDVGKSWNAVTIPIRTPPIVAPIRGIRSRNAISTARGAANGVPMSFRVT